MPASTEPYIYVLSRKWSIFIILCSSNACTYSEEESKHIRTYECAPLRAKHTVAVGNAAHICLFIQMVSCVKCSFSHSN